MAFLSAIKGCSGIDTQHDEQAYWKGVLEENRNVSDTHSKMSYEFSELCPCATRNSVSRRSSRLV